MANTKSKSNRKNKTQKNIEKTIKKTHPITLLIGLVSLVVGIVAGYFASSFITKNDTFELVGESEVSFLVGSTGVYTDEGVTCISYGRDLSKNVVINTNMIKNSDGTYAFDTAEEGEYYIIYTIDDIKYKGIQRVRVITVGGTNE